MTEIAYTGVHERTLNQIKKYLQNENLKLVEISEREVVESFRNRDALLLGEEVDNPIQIVQQIYKNDKDLSILIIKDPDQFPLFRKALLFTPFVGNSVRCTTNENAEELASTIEEIAVLTSSRRKYKTIRTTVVPFESTPNLEALKRLYLDKFFDQVPIGAVLVDKSGIISIINSYTAKIFNQHETDILGSSLFEFFPNQGLKLREILELSDIDVKEDVFERNSPDLHYLRVTVSSLNIRNFENFKNVLLYDVTETIQAKIRIENQLEELHTSNEELKKANSDLDNFIYTASHDLKAPVSNIEGLIDSMKDVLKQEYGSIKPDTDLLLQMMETSVNRFKNTILDLTEISKAQRLEGEDINELDSREVIKDVLLNLQDQLVSSGANLVTGLYSKTSIHFSKKNFRSIVYNLISNAIKYRSPERQLLIEISTTVRSGYFVLTVKDNGLGISQENIPRIFSMFKRFHDHVEGTGVGLYIVKRIVDNAGGKIEVESEPGKGTEFRIFLRL